MDDHGLTELALQLVKQKWPNSDEHTQHLQAYMLVKRALAKLEADLLSRQIP